MNEIILYKSVDGNIKVDVLFEEETVWLTQGQMAALFGKGRTTITEHIQNIFSEGELDPEVVCREFRHTTQHGAIEGKTQEVSVKYYNLDVIISVGYRVKSHQGTQFRIWATQRLREYIMSNLVVRKIKDMDLPHIEEISCEDNDFELGIRVMVENWKLDIDRGYDFVALYKQKIIGFIHSYVLDTTLYPQFIFVKHEYRERGIGQKLLQTAEDNSKCTSSLLYHHKSLHNFYERQGYLYGKELEVALKPLGRQGV